MKLDERVRLIGNIVDSLKSVPREIQSRQLAQFYKADLAYGRSVEVGLEAIKAKAIG